MRVVLTKTSIRTTKVNVKAEWNDNESMLEFELPAEGFKQEKLTQVVPLKKKAAK